MSEQAAGTFTIDLWDPQDPYDDQDGVTLGRTTIRKVFDGDLLGTSEVQMTSVMAAASGSAAYVALEKVHGTLGGRKGSFVLRHAATASEAGQSSEITVVPGTGTGDLTGLVGTFVITKTDAGHTWTFDYTLG
ncbi:DUF3224 domain-containing protein [Actinokineospora sp. NBRC 105648]|uniref:DUF3224 domain-containing protein n=1 Tax=Actinokineospora sp. NBRC 105648 TaxID=3032206 RepID=UPI0024A2C41D|nr:DUF3224 domain-containing protein [Actinokineospora sp. NBRC 105648]GLZ39642.1 hypothetical protein Acsp05_32660 [Actinokineospora sp. NBRC 105648]